MTAKKTTNDETPDDEASAESEEAPAKSDSLVEKAEALLVPPAAGYNSHDQDYNRGVQAVIDLLRSES
jgi:hypothetical protein